MKGKATKKVSSLDRDTLKAEYARAELGKGVRGKYFHWCNNGTNVDVVVLSPDVADAFPDSKSVNTALRSAMRKEPARIPRSAKSRRAPG